MSKKCNCEKWFIPSERMPPVMVDVLAKCSQIIGTGYEVVSTYRNYKGEIVFPNGWRKGEQFEVLKWKFINE